MERRWLVVGMRTVLLFNQRVVGCLGVALDEKVCDIPGVLLVTGMMGWMTD